jgi:hypothetical protein
MALAVAASLTAAAVVLPQVPQSLARWPDYGIRWQHRPKAWRTLVEGSAGLNIRARRGVVALELRARPAEGETGDTEVEVRLGRRPATREVIAPGESRKLEYRWPRRSLVFVELRASSAVSGAPRQLLVIVRRPR